MKTMNALDRLRAELSKEEGFTLIELLIVMSVMLIPDDTGGSAAFEAEKAGAGDVCGPVAADDRSGGVAIQLGLSGEWLCVLAGHLGGDPKSGAPSAEAAQMITPDLASGQKAGYSFAITNCTKVTVNNQDMYTGYEITAVPNSIGRTGDRGFCTDENSTIRFDPAGGTNCTQPIQ